MSDRPVDQEREYVLVYDHPPHAKAGTEEVAVPRNTIVTVRHVNTDSLAHAVILGGNTTLEFTVKATGEKHRTNFGYMFADNTPENLALLAEAREAHQRYLDANLAMKRAFARVALVRGPFEAASRTR